jgi:hypothetical protein
MSLLLPAKKISDTEASSSSRLLNSNLVVNKDMVLLESSLARRFRVQNVILFAVP